MSIEMFWLNLLAILCSPVIAVLVGQWLQRQAKKRDEKMYLFKVLMMSRAIITYEYVLACNTIDIVFSDEKLVRERWKELYDKLHTEEASDAELQKIATARYRLLEAIAVSLGYKDKITWETIQNPYIPKWITDNTKNQENYHQLVNTAVQYFDAGKKN